MNKSTYQQVYTEHFCHQLWGNDLVMADQELTLYAKIFSELAPTGHTPPTSQSTDLNQQINHYRRLVPTLQKSLNELEKQLAIDVQQQDRIGAETRKDHIYFEEQMRDFERNYRQFRQAFRAFIATTR